MNQLREYGQDKEWQKNQRSETRFSLEQDRVEDPELEAYLKDVDWEEINQYLTKEVGKSGSEIDSDAPVGRSSFFLVRPDDVQKRSEPESGVYDPVSRLVRLFPENLRARAEKTGISPKVWLLYFVCHESIHDFSFTRIKGIEEFFKPNSFGFALKRLLGWRVPPNSDKQVTIESGFRRDEITKTYTPDLINAQIDKQQMHEPFDEGATIKVTLEMLEAYRKKHPEFLSRKELDALISVFNDPKSLLPQRRQYVQNVNNFIKELSAELDVNPSIVWQAIKRGKFGAENINDEETKQILEAELPPGLVSRAFRSR